MKRYHFLVCSDHSAPRDDCLECSEETCCRMMETPYGDYVRLEDVEKLRNCQNCIEYKVGHCSEDDVKSNGGYCPNWRFSLKEVERGRDE